MKTWSQSAYVETNELASDESHDLCQQPLKIILYNMATIICVPTEENEFHFYCKRISQMES